MARLGRRMFDRLALGIDITVFHSPPEQMTV